MEEFENNQPVELMLFSFLIEENSIMTKKIERLRKEIKKLKEDNRYIFIIRSSNGEIISSHLDYDKAVQRIQNRKEHIQKLVKNGLIDSNVAKSFYLTVSLIED